MRTRSGLPTVRQLAEGWRWGSRPLVPASAEPYRPLPPERREFSTAWARTPLARSLRAVAQSAGLKPLVWSEVTPAVSGLDVLSDLNGPVVFVANHTSHLDAPLVLCALPPAWRRETLVAAAADYFFEDWWRAVGTALVFGTVPLDRTGGTDSASTPQELLADGWNLLLFPEGTRSAHGQLGSFKTGAARLALGTGAPIVPIGIRGSFAAMPRGRSWPIPGRPRVAVRFGPPVRPRRDESAKRFTNRVAAEIQRLTVEDRTTWWESMRTAGGNRPAAHPAGREAVGGSGLSRDGGPVAHWRRVWASTEPVVARERSTPWD